MSQLNFGERYFTARERISQVFKGIAKLARDTATDLGASITDDTFAKEPGTPFLFVVCGEVNAGKSSLLNGLFGTELCKVNNLPETEKVTFYRYAAEAHETVAEPLLVEHCLPIDFLKDFNLVDTPGTNSIAKDHHKITERFLLTAELILFVFPVTNPWGSATWQMISELPKECHSRIAFIIQQADQREEADLKVIIEHMADLSMKRIGAVPQIFAVSGKMAFEAKRSRTSGEREYGKSGFPALEQYISHHVCDSTERRKALHAWRNNASTALLKIEHRIEAQSELLNDQNRFLASIEDEIDAMRERLVSRLPQHLGGVAVVFETEAVWVTRSLQKWLGIARSVFRIFVGDHTGSDTEALFIERLRIAVEAVAESDGADVVAACHSHWDELGIRVREEIGMGVDEQEPINEKLEQARIRFVQRIGRAAHQAIGNLHVRKELERELRRRNLALKSFTASTLILLILGSICGIVGVPWMSGIFCGIALIFILGGVVIAMITRLKISRDFQNSLLDTCGAFAETLRTDYEDALRIFFQEYTICLNSIRKHIARQKLAIEPKLARWHGLFLTLKSIEQDD